MTLEDAVRRYISVSRQILLHFFPVNSCIQSTRACIEVFASFGWHAKAQPVQMAVANKASKVCFTTGLSPESKQAAKTAAKNYTELQPDDPDCWHDGHLVAMVDRWFIDSSFDQATIAVPSLPREPLAFRMPPDFDIATQNVTMDAITGDGVEFNIQYAGSDDHSYLDTPAWDEGLLPVQPIVRAMISGRAAPEELPMFTVYRVENGCYAVQRWVMKDGETRMDRNPWGFGRGEMGLEILRADMRSMGLVKMGRWPGDAANIIEVWI